MGHRNKAFQSPLWLTILLSLAGACAGSDGDPAKSPNVPVVPGVPVALTPPESETAERTAIALQLAEAESMTRAELQMRYASAPGAVITYKAADAAHMDRIQGSALALNGAELTKLNANGFVISKRSAFGSFPRGYEAIYMTDLPVFVSADSILYAVHRSYDDILKAIETEVLIQSLSNLLDGMRARLAGDAINPLGAQAGKDADLYLTVALRLLKNDSSVPVVGADKSEVAALVAKAVAASGVQNVVLFGVAREMDFSQFTPRGHYTDSEALTRYFKAMMWLGRIDFRLIETKPDHTQVFHRRQWDGALALAALVDDAAMANWQRLDDVNAAFIGEPDNLTLPQMKTLSNTLGGASLADLNKLDDATIAKAIVSGGHGAQRISSHVMMNGLGQGTMPLSRTFLLMGQRYVIDSHVFSNVVFDRVKKGTVKRMMPNPLDVAFAALGNNQAAALLNDEMTKYDYAADLAAMRMLADAHPPAYWDANLYNRWLGVLRALSPAKSEQTGLPTIARTEAWGRRLLNTQLASWAELRHDTILYVKQSYTSGLACEFPDAYVEPYPEFFAAIGGMASHGAGLVASLGLTGGLGNRVVSYFDSLKDVAAILQEMAEFQRTGMPHTAAHMAFINDAVKIQNVGCAPDQISFSDGWYRKLFFDPSEGAKRDPTVADVYTQPTDADGVPVVHVLHVATGDPRQMVVAIETCSGPRAYVGVASSYHEVITNDFKRLDDKAWTDMLNSGPAADVPWMQSLVAQ